MKIKNEWLSTTWFGSVIVALLFGMLCGMTITERKYRNAAYERGYAEWVVPEGGRDRTVWQWVEPEGGEEND